MAHKALAILATSLLRIIHARDVVAVADGGTITVLENRTQHKIRLYGIDAPEGGNRDMKFISDLV